MKRSIIAAASVLAFAVLSSTPQPVLAASGYKCKGNANSARFTGKFKKGRIQVAGRSFPAKVNSDGSVTITLPDDTAVLREGGVVTGRTGGTSGKHNCDLATVISAVQGN